MEPQCLTCERASEGVRGESCWMHGMVLDMRIGCLVHQDYDPYIGLREALGGPPASLGCCAKP